MANHLMTEANKTTVESVADGSQVNVLESVTVNAAALTITSKGVTLPQANATDTDGVMTWEDKAKSDRTNFIANLGGDAPDTAYDESIISTAFRLVVNKKYHVQANTCITSGLATCGFRIGLKLLASGATAVLKGIVRTAIVYTDIVEAVAPLYAISNTAVAGSYLETTAGDTTHGSMVSIDAIVYATAGTTTQLDLLVYLASETADGVNASANHSSLVITEVGGIV